MTLLTERLAAAVEYARVAHDEHVRKGSDIPYLYHLLAVCSLVLEYGGSEDQAIAGLLHDAVEDGGAHHEAAIRERFGEAVAAIVMDCTDGTAEGRAEERTKQERIADWWARKLAYLEHLRHEPDASLLVGGCDKLHNARAIVHDLEDPKVGVAVFGRFTAGREGTLRYYQAIAEILTVRGAPMARAFDAVVSRMHALAGATTRRSLETAVPIEDIRAYLETDYRVHGDSAFTLRVGEVSEALQATQAHHGATGSAYLTAWNPLGQATAASENAERHAALEALLQGDGLAHAPGIGQHPSGEWPGEESLLVHGLTLEAAFVLGERFEQNAILWAGADGVPELILLR